MSDELERKQVDELVIAEFARYRGVNFTKADVERLADMIVREELFAVWVTFGERTPCIAGAVVGYIAGRRAR